MKKRSFKAAVWLAAAALLFLAGYLLGKGHLMWLNPLLIGKGDIVGVDLSRYQHRVDMEKLRDQGIRFAFIKATEGSSHVDRQFQKNWENAGKAGLLSGAYHFFSYESPGESQAGNYIETVGDLTGHLIPVVDVEYYRDKKENPPEKEDVVRELGVFLDRLEERYGVKPMIYTRPEIFRKYLKGAFDAYPKWISSISCPIWLVYRGDWCFWQYTNRGELEGYSGGHRYIDLNVLRRGLDLDSFLIPAEKP